MTSIRLMLYISEHPEFNGILFLDEECKTRTEAVHRLSENYEQEKDIDWKVNPDPNQEDILLIYTNL